MSYVPNYSASQFTNAITGAIGATGLCYAANIILVFDPNPLEDYSASTSAETGRADRTLAKAMPDGTSNTLCISHRYKVCSSSINGTYAGAPGIPRHPFQTTPAPDTCHPNVTQSPHPGAMMVCLGDGSVRSVDPSISTRTWYNACHPYDRNPLGSAW